LQRLDPAQHADHLFDSNVVDETGANWTYLTYGPFPDRSSYRTWVSTVAGQSEPLFFAVLSTDSGSAVGVASFLRVFPAAGSIEVGHINFSPLLQRTRAGTEAGYLMMRRVFDDWGYRRYEWKCNALNAPSMAAADRLGFTFVGVFRQAEVSKGRNRDTAWLSVIDSEWPATKRAFETWLEPANFAGNGNQRASLAAIRRR
jgi:RimJ/RimL family protein N-acetyltransferase